MLCCAVRRRERSRGRVVVRHRLAVWCVLHRRSVNVGAGDGVGVLFCVLCVVCCVLCCVVLCCLVLRCVCVSCAM
jgi:hypothetical protein